MTKDEAAELVDTLIFCAWEFKETEERKAWRDHMEMRDKVIAALQGIDPA
jgi:uncharacterized protein with HEPN domain